jgi:DNA-binding MarR family transcriptional regulator
MEDFLSDDNTFNLDPQIEYIQKLLLTSKDKSYHVLSEIYSQYNYHTGSWNVDKNNKKLICDKMSISNSTLEKHIKSLKDRDMLQSLGKGTYKIIKVNISDI